MEAFDVHNDNRSKLAHNQARKLVDFFIGPDEVNMIYGTTLSEEDCSIGFSEEDISTFKKHIETSLPPEMRFIVLILMIEKDGARNQIDHSYIGTDFVEYEKVHRTKYNKIGTLVYWYYPPVWHQDLRKRSREEKLCYAWLLVSLCGSGIYNKGNLDEQIALAHNRGEEVLSYLEESYLQQTLYATAIKCGDVLKFFDFERTRNDADKLYVPHDTRITRTKVCGGNVNINGAIPIYDRSHQRIDVGITQKEDLSSDYPLATAIVSPIPGDQPEKTRFDTLKDFWGSKRIFQTLDIKVLEIKRGFAKVSMPARNEFSNHFNALSGAIISQLADCSMGVALSSLTSHHIVTRVLESEFISSVMEGDSIEAVCNVNLRDEQELEKIRNPKENKLVSLTAKVYKPDGTLVSVHNGTFVVLPLRKS